MYQLRQIYGQMAFDRWMDIRRTGMATLDELDLRDYRQDASCLPGEPWKVRTYSELVDVVSFLAVMNHRLELVFRGQRRDWGSVLPTLYRDTWAPPEWSELPRAAIGNRRFFIERLAALGPQ